MATEETKTNDIGDKSINKYSKETTGKNIILKKGVHHRKDHCTFKKRNWQMGFKLSEVQGWLCAPFATAVGGTRVC